MDKPNSPLLAAAFMLMASALIAGTTLLAKLVGGALLGEGLHPLQISQGRFLFAWIALVSVALVLRPRIERPDIKLHAARSLAGWGGVSLMFAAVTFIPLADATAISFLNPIFAMLLAIPLLGERVGKWRWLAAGIAIMGGVVLLRPGSGAIEPGAILALGAAVVLGFEIILIKRLSGREPVFQILIMANTFGLIISTLAVLFVWTPPSGAQLGALAALGLMMAAAQTMFVQSLRRADASFAVPFSYAALIFATLYDFAIFDVIPVGTTVLGAGLIVAGAALLMWREGRARART